MDLTLPRLDLVGEVWRKPYGRGSGSETQWPLKVKVLVLHDAVGPTLVTRLVLRNAVGPTWRCWSYVTLLVLR